MLERKRPRVTTDDEGEVGGGGNQHDEEGDQEGLDLSSKRRKTCNGGSLSVRSFVKDLRRIVTSRFILTNVCRYMIV